MKTQTLSFFALIATLFSACSTEYVPPVDVTLDAKSAQLVTQSNEFGFNLFEEIVANEAPGKNLMISPLSASQALSMTLNGARENTFDQMNAVLGNSKLSIDEVNTANKTLADVLLNRDSKVQLSIANSIWYRNDLSVKSDFLNTNKQFYKAEVSDFNPSQPDKALKAINNWVNANTKGKIPSIIEKINAEDVMFLINAVYFKGEWKTKFEKSKTSNEPFTLDNGTVRQVPTMMGEVSLSYYNDEKFSVIKLPYGAGKFNLYVYLPEEGVTTSEIVPLIHTTKFELLKSQSLSKREIWLPKFEFKYEITMNDALFNLGMTDAFSRNLANLTGIADADLFISQVKQKTWIKTDESGSEAAAVTSVTVGMTSVGPSETIKIDRSFLFAIVEEDTHAVLFVGRMFDPTLSE